MRSGRGHHPFFLHIVLPVNHSDHLAGEGIQRYIHANDIGILFFPVLSGDSLDISIIDFIENIRMLRMAAS